MKGLAEFVVKNRVAILIIAAVLLVPSVYGMQHRKVQYDLLTYLPKDLNSVEGMNVLDEEFKYAERAFVVCRNQPDWAVLKVKEKLEHVDGVSSVFWLSDLVDPTIPHDYLGEDIVSKFYRGQITLLIVNFEEDAVSPRTERAVNDIKNLLDKEQWVIGALVSGLELKDLGVEQTPVMVRTAVLFILILLFLTLPSPLMPLVFMGTIGVAYAYNMGINYLLGRDVSYVTNAVASAMQLGVTMDYCIFLLHTFQTECEKHDSEEAMVRAITYTANAVLSSATTTAVGFGSLALMRITLGADMGILMARGVLLSVICCLTILPSLVLTLNPILGKWNHPVILPSYKGLGDWLTEQRVPVFALTVVLALVGLYGYNKIEPSYDIESTFPMDLPSIAALQEFKDDLGSVEEAYIITRGVPQWRLQELTRQIREMDGVKDASCLGDVVDPGIPVEFVPEGVSKQYVGGEYENTVITLEGSILDPRTPEFITQTRELIKDLPGEVYFTGTSVIGKDLEDLSSKDLDLVNWVSMAGIFAIVAIAFKSWTVPILLILAIKVAIWVNQAISYFTGAPVFFFSRMAIEAIQLGATVDYAILVTNTFKGKLNKNAPPDAMRSTVAECGPAVLNSGLAMFCAIIGVYASTNLRAIKDLALLLARGALVSVAVTSFMLPATLVVCNPILEKTSIGWPRHDSVRQAGTSAVAASDDK